MNAGVEQWTVQECGTQGHVESTPGEVLGGLLRLPLERNHDREQCTAGHLQDVQLRGIQTASTTRCNTSRVQSWAHEVSCFMQAKQTHQCTVPSVALACYGEGF